MTIWSRIRDVFREERTLGGIVGAPLEPAAATESDDAVVAS